MHRKLSSLRVFVSHEAQGSSGWNSVWARRW